MATLVDFFKVWDEKNRSHFQKHCKNILAKLKNTSLAMSSEGDADISQQLYELCLGCISGSIPVEDVSAALHSIVTFHTDLPSFISDILSVLDTASQVKETHREKYLALLRACTNKVVPEYVLKERLEFDTISEAGIMPNLKSTQAKFIKAKTRLFYKQQKYNLYREENEGFAKLITELEPSGDHNVEHTLQVTQSLIGCFNLDPNRVLDVILEKFERNVDSADFFAKLLHSYSSTSDTISQVLGFKFGFYQMVQEEKAETPASLYRVAAFLLKSKIIKLSQIYNLLTPDDSKIVDEHNLARTNAESYVKKLNSLLTNPTETSKTAEETPNESPAEENQKLGLLVALLDIGDWEHARQLIAQFPEYYATSHPIISTKLCKLIHVLTEYLYKKMTFLPQIKKPQPMKLQYGKVKQVENFNEFFKDIFEMLCALGPYLHTDPVLMVKISRLCRNWMIGKTGSPEAGVSCISTFIEQALLPSLSLLENNCCVSEEIWSLLKLFPYQSRYKFYFSWQNTAYATHPLLIKQEGDTVKKLKYIMKRLSKENVKPTGRQIGKLSHSNPSCIFHCILSQIQTYDNLIMPVIDSLKYLTSLSYDVLAYCIVEALSNSEKDRMKHDGTSISLWLQSLASFAGSVFKKYPIDISGLLQHVANQLIAGRSLDLLILKEVIQKMAGVEAAEEMTAHQLEAMTGGELLRSEGGYFNQFRNVKKSSQRLKEALLEQDLAIPLALLMSQQKNSILFHEQENSHIKLVGKLFDQCQDTLVQYGCFLANNLNMEDYIDRLPIVSKLLSDYSIQADTAFYFSRPSINHVINSKFEEFQKQIKSEKSYSLSQILKKYMEIVNVVLSPIVVSVRSNLYLKKAWSDLNPQFYITFWSLNMYDLVVPITSYEREINKLKAFLANEENKDASKKKKERERCDSLIQKLTDEQRMQEEHCQRIMGRLKTEKDDWFYTKVVKSETIAQFLQLCLFPRCIFTPVDALYCARFVRLIHSLKTPNFSTLLLLDRLFFDIGNTLAACTENEANRYGLLLCSMLETVMLWHKDKDVFAKECANHPGFMTKFKVSDKSIGESNVDHVDYENYRHICHKWNFKIARGILKCLDSKSYIQIRNGLLVLRKISPHFPVLSNISSALERRMDKIKAEEKDVRPDLYVLATGYAGVLKSKKGTLIPEYEFHQKPLKSPKVDATPKSEKRDIETTPENQRERSRLEAKSEGGKIKFPTDRSSSSPQSNSTGKRPRSETEQNGIESGRSVKVPRIKEEKSSQESSGSPLRREEKTKPDSERVVTPKEDTKRGRREKASGASDHEADSHSSHRSRGSDSVESGEREHKRRRTEPLATRISREHDSKVEERNGNREKNSSEKVHDSSSPEKKKKASRKREYPEEGGAEPRRRGRVKQERDAEESALPDREVKLKRDDSIHTSSSERRSERDEKKHHRSSSASSSSTKKRS